MKIKLTNRIVTIVGAKKGQEAIELVPLVKPYPERTLKSSLFGRVYVGGEKSKTRVYGNADKSKTRVYGNVEKSRPELEDWPYRNRAIY